ncbi:MAG: NAD(P)/FAD-dependent oxidoreductase [Desulfobacteraceae bacterium]|nr:NAD(P)/FAD-dependent oxidoreductase [Desulfobacteraceae bacterium]
MTQTRQSHIVIIGAGFAGLEAARSFKNTDARITIIDKNNHHLFQPLLYQVATAGLSPADIASPIRWILRNQKNVSVMLGEVLGIDPKCQFVRLHDQELSYDYLILATGMTHSYFGQNQWAQFAPGLKILSETIEIRRRILLAFETAEKCVKDPIKEGITTFAVIGGGPTGVEMAGAIAELTRLSMKEDFRKFDIRQNRVILIEAGPRLLPAMPEKLSQKAKEALENIGVEVLLSSSVTDIQEDYILIDDRQIKTRTVIWAAGLSASPLTGEFGADLDRAGRIKVNPDLSVPGHDNIFAVGDLAYIEQADHSPVPGMAPAAIQEGRLAAKNILLKIVGKNTLPFKYKDKGRMATIGRAAAVANVGPFNFSGMLAWITWLTIHIFFLIGFRNRLLVLIQWTWSYFSLQRHARLITHPWRFWKPGLPDEQTSRMPGCHCKVPSSTEKSSKKLHE